MSGRGRGLIMALCGALLLAGCREDPGRQAYRQGLRELKRGNYSQSIRLLEKSVKACLPEARSGDTNLPLAALYNSLGLAYYRIGQRENALGAFESSAQLEAQCAEGVYNAGVVLAESGRNAQAAGYFAKAAQLDAAGTRALEYQSRIFYQQRRWNDALAALNEARARAPGEPRILTALALLELRATNVAPAISRLQEALSHDARYTPAIYNLAMVNQLWLKNDAQAAKLFKDYLRLAPQGPGAARAKEALRSIAQWSPALAPGETAVGSLTSASASRSGPSAQRGASVPVPADSPVEPGVVSYDELLRLARMLQQQGRSEAAVSNFLLAARAAERAGKPSVRDLAVREAEGSCAKSARAHYEAGLYWVERGRPDDALKHLKLSAELSNTWFEAHLALARVAVEKSEFDTAVIALKQADQNHPDQPEALWMLAQLYDHNLSLTSQAIQAYERFARRFADDERVAEARARLKALQSGPAGTGASSRRSWLSREPSSGKPQN